MNLSKDFTPSAHRSSPTNRIPPGLAIRTTNTSATSRKHGKSGRSVPVTAETLLGKKCHALRIASVQARDEGWLAEHMLILKLTSPQGEVKYVTGAFPSACGKTNLAMLIPTVSGWKVETIGDDIAWMKFGKDAGSRHQSRGRFLWRRSRNGETPDNDVWWEGMTEEKPSSLIDWLRRPWTPRSGRPAAHPNARFTVPASQCPAIAPEWEDPKGVPIDAILFGGRRGTVVPLVMESFNWQHGVFLGATSSSETTAAAAGKVGQLRRDPMAMLPFCGYNMGDYLAHWLRVGSGPGKKMPKIFYVNWFRKDEKGFLWPGYGENSRVLKWVFERCNGTANAVDTAIGRLPVPADIDVKGLDVSAETMTKLLTVDKEGWKAEIPLIRGFFASFGSRVPAALNEEVNRLELRLK